MEKILKEFFKTYVTMGFDIESIRFSSIYNNNSTILFNLRHLFLFEQYFYEQQLARYLPDESHLVTHEKLLVACKRFIDLIVFKFIEKTKDFLSVDSKLYMLTLFELFEEPFEVY